jgi:multidrug resistance efflux pump|nr:biotin/lipoyl-binding protein [uncultured Emticicia sp.]
MKKYFLFFITITILSSCNKKEKEKAEKAKADSLATIPSTNNQILGVARIEPEDGILSLTAGANGKVLEVLIKENQIVQKGQSLLMIDNSIENAQLFQSESKIGTQKAMIEVSQSNLEVAKVSLKNAFENYQRNLRLFEGNAQTKQAVEDSKALVDKLMKDVEASTANIEQSKSRMKELEADIIYYSTIVNQKKVNSLVSGKVLKVTVKTGDYINNITQIAEFAPKGSLIAKTEVDELYAEKIQIGQKAFIISQTTGDTLAHGSVSYTADYLKQKSLFKDQATEQEDRRVRDVSIRLESGKMPLIGSRVDCVILLK